MFAVEMTEMIKQYPLTRAVDQVDFTLREGEIHSLLGENGAGKSTLMKILYGMCRPDSGVIRVKGEKVSIKNPADAIRLGIGMVHQHFMLAPVMTVAENIVTGSEPVKGFFLDHKRAAKSVGEMAEKYGFHLSPTAYVKDLSVGEQQRVEILKALYHGADILILDEPTAVLTPQEVDELFAVMRELKKNGKSIVIITHKLKETLAIADRMSVLRDGRMVERDLLVENTTTEDLARLMVGRDVKLGISRRTKCAGEVRLTAEGLTLKQNGKAVLKEISLQLRKGEILGIAGIEGNGQTELIELLTGLRKPDSGKILKDGQELTGNAKQFLFSGIGHIPEDRHDRGLITELSIRENLILGYHRRAGFSQKGFLRHPEIRRFAAEKIGEYAIKAPDPDALLKSLSGGNQQKVVIARVFSEDPDVIIIAQPTRGVDIGAMEYIHKRLLDLRDEGKAILLISADLDEVKTLSDRLHIIYDGRIVANAAPGELSDIQLGLLMTGGKEGGAAI